MSHLLVPEDEQTLTAWLCEELGARLLLSDIAPSGEPRIAHDPLRALPRELPVPATPGCREIYDLLFWLPDCGAIATMRDAPEPSDVRDRVAQTVTRQSAGDAFGDVIDTTRTPVLLLRRSKRLSDTRLAPGTLATMPLPHAELPADVARAHAKVTRWLKKARDQDRSVPALPRSRPQASRQPRLAVGLGAAPCDGEGPPGHGNLAVERIASRYSRKPLSKRRSTPSSGSTNTSARASNCNGRA